MELQLQDTSRYGEPVANFLLGIFVSLLLYLFGAHFSDQSESDLFNARVATAHALLDGRASLEGYEGLPDAETRDSPSLSPVTTSDAAAAVIADQTAAATFASEASILVEHARWLWGGSAAVLLLTLRGASSAAWRWLRSRQTQRSQSHNHPRPDGSSPDALAGQRSATDGMEDALAPEAAPEDASSQPHDPQSDNRRGS